MPGRPLCTQDWENKRRTQLPWRKGDRPRVRITLADTHAMRRADAAGTSGVDLARQYHTRPETISRIAQQQVHVYRPDSQP